MKILLPWKTVYRWPYQRISRNYVKGPPKKTTTNKKMNNDIQNTKTKTKD